MPRTVVPASTTFFNDGFWYVLTSSSLGGSSYSLDEIDEILQAPIDSDDIDAIAALESLVRDGICLPLFFDGDCALDNAVVVIGDLSEREEAEWIGRLRSKLEIPCGKFILSGSTFTENLKPIQEGSPPDDENVRIIDIQPGSYSVEVYAFVGSLTVNEILEDSDSPGVAHLSTDAEAIVIEPLDEWWERTRPNSPPPEWLVNAVEDDNIVDDEGLLEYIIKLTPSQEVSSLPALEQSTHWCGVFDIRRPELCPQGIMLHSFQTT